VRVLYLTHRLPFAPNRGDRIRSYHLLEGLRAAAKVTLVSLVHDAAEAGQVTSLEDRGVDVSVARVGGPVRWARAGLALAGSRPLTHVLLDSPELAPAIRRAVDAAAPDVVVAFCSGMAKFALDPPLDRFPFVLDMVDVDSEKWRSLADSAAPPRSWIYAREARVLSAFERVATERAVTTLVVNEKERAALTAMAPSADIRTLTSGIDVDEFRPPGPPSPSANVVFCGVMNYAPNEEGAIWLVREVWPRVIARRPDARLQLVGSRPTKAVRALAGQTVTVTGTVPHTRDYLWNAAAAVAPLLTARGLQNKVLEALAGGAPVVVTPGVRSGLPDNVAAGCLVAATPQEFADAIVALLDQPTEARRARARAVDLQGLSWHGLQQQFVDIVTAAARRGA
jgi:sugar transferase (PEP-CTERM/EpsH1 system associated)